MARGEYKCECCGEIVPPTLFDEDKRKRVPNVFVDHVKPIIDPEVGFVSWDDTIDRMFCDSSNLQLICGKCHRAKSEHEIEIAKARRAKEKND